MVSLNREMPSIVGASQEEQSQAVASSACALRFSGPAGL